MPREAKDKDKFLDRGEEGRFEFGGKRAMIVDVAGGFYALKKTLRADIGFFERDFMFRAGLEGARSYFSEFETVLRDKSVREALEILLEQYSLRGYGDFKIRRLEEDKKIFEVSSPNTTEGWAFQTNRDLQREPVCSYVSGVLSFIGRLVFSAQSDTELDVRAVELECVAQGMRECRFIVAPTAELTKLVPKHEVLRESISEHVLRLNEEILLKNLELQSLNLSLERQVRKRTEELRRSEENYRLLVELSPDPIVICTAEGAIISVNEAGVKMLGYDSISEADGHNMKSILSDGAMGWEKLAWLLEKEGSVHGVEMEFVKKDGTKMVGEVSARYAVLLPGRCVEAVVRDVTERKMMHQQMVEAKSESEFLNDLLSHDITNYTTSALYFLNSLRNSAKLTEEERRSLMIGLKDLEGAFELSISVRDLARIKSLNNKDVEVKELQSLIAEGIEETKRLFSERKIRINFERAPNPRFIRGNALVSRMFANVFSNAIKFDRNEEAIVDVEIKSQVDHGLAFWRIDISDRGSGIPDSEKEKVFERFHRIDSSIPGTGLGLFVARFIAKACGGNIWTEDRITGDSSKGTKMVIALQKATERQVAALSRR